MTLYLARTLLPADGLVFCLRCYTRAMRPNLKTFLLWLIIATLPLQGLAAVMKISCQPVQHATMQVAAVAHEHHQTHSASAQHGSTAAQHAGDTVPDHTSAKDHHATHSSCSACAACCFGASAPPSSMMPMLAPGSSALVFAALPIFATGITPAGLERPPKRS